jgi:hypothetical protein
MEPLPLPNPKAGSFEAYERSAGILESVADKYAKGSVERELLKKAAFALFFSTVYFSEQFEDFLSKFENTELSAEQRAHLRSMGIDPDAPLHDEGS